MEGGRGDGYPIAGGIAHPPSGADDPGHSSKIGGGVRGRGRSVHRGSPDATGGVGGTAGGIGGAEFSR